MGMTVTLERFSFDLDFGAETQPRASLREEAVAQVEEEIVAEEAPPAPSYSEEELEAARSAAYAKGCVAGREDARRASEERLILALEGLGRSLVALGNALEADREASQAAAAGTAFLLVRRLFPQLAERFGKQEMETLVNESLRGLRNEPRVVVRVSDEQLDLLRDRIDSLAERAGFDGKLVLIAEETLAAGDVRVEWADGGAERVAARLWQAAEERFMSAFDLAPDLAARRTGPSRAAAARTATGTDPEIGYQEAEPGSQDPNQPSPEHP